MSTEGYNASSASEGSSYPVFGSDSLQQEPHEERGLDSGRDGAPLFGIDYKKNDDLKAMLEGNKDNQKLEAMKIIIGMVAKGKDVSHLFPFVVKNVVSKNQEIKKLVYVYLVRYAEEQQDLALLSISTFQKGLKDPNQLIRAGALRVLSSIRVPIIAPIMMLAIKDSVNDLSPYVRKTAAHAIPKLYSLDPEQKEQLIEVIEKLLKDQTTLVAGSIVMAFEIVCPDRIDLIHKNYRKLCNLLVDVDEWGQVAILNMLTRYARTQFTDPNKEGVEDAPFYEEDENKSSDEKGSGDEEGDKKDAKPKKPHYVMDADHRLLLKNCKPLLQSRNAAVVVAVAQLYHHLAPKNEVGIVAKPLIRLLKGHREVQSIVLGTIATLSTQRPGLFEPYLKSFFVHSGDSSHVRLLKLDIIANIAGETSIHTVLREFKTYIASSDVTFAAATIQAIGRVACSISGATETCLHGLMSLLSHKNEFVVGESVIVIKKLLQLQPKENKELIAHMARLVDSVKLPMAKASILWLVGEYCNLVPKIAPDVLRKAAKIFPTEEEIVKLQIINLAAKLCTVNPKQTKLLCQYILNMAKYDQNYDVRDRARFLRQLVQPEGEQDTALSQYAKKILMATKPAPVLESNYKARAQWQLGSLSHLINAQATGYIPLSDFPTEAPDPSVRVIEEPVSVSSSGKQEEKKSKKKEGASFYDNTDKEEEEDVYSSISGSDESEEEDESGSGTEESEEDGSEEEDKLGVDKKEEDSEEEEEEESSESEEDALQALQQRYGKKPVEKQKPSESEEEESASEKSDSEESEESEEAELPKAKPKAVAKATPATKKESSLLLLDDWDSTPTPATTATLATGDLLKPLSSTAGFGAVTKSVDSSTGYKFVVPTYVPKQAYDLLNRISGNGLSVTYTYTRRAHLSSSKMIGFELMFQNTSSSSINNIEINKSQLQSGMQMTDIPSIPQLGPGASISVSLGINFNDTLQPASFSICVGQGMKYPVQIEPLVGEVLKPVSMSESDFITRQEKLTGMHEGTDKALVMDSTANESIKKTILEKVNMYSVETLDTTALRFAAVTFSSGVPVLLTLTRKEGVIRINVNTEKMVVNQVLIKTVKQALSNV